MYQPASSIYTPPPRPKVIPLRGKDWQHAIARPRYRRPPVIAKLNAPQVRENLCALPLHISNHSLTIWNSCKRKHLWTHGYGLYPTGQSEHLIAGGAVAAGLEAARAYVFAQSDPQSVGLQAMLMAAYPAFSTAWGDFTPADKPRLTKTFSNTFDALRFYLEQHHPALDQIQPARRVDGKPAIEYRFAVPLDILHPSGEPFILIGRFDMLGVMDIYGQEIPVVLDDKTTGSITQNWASQWDMWGQFMCYIWALQKQGIDCNHAAVRGLAILKQEHKTSTAILEYPQHMIDRWERMLYKQLHLMVRAYEAKANDSIGEHELESHFPYNMGSACTDYGGCAYSTLCISHEPRDFMSNYVLHRYNALEQQPVEEVEKEAAA